MRALTLHQPWAALVASGAKLIENRKVRPPASLIGERFAIHAGLAPGDYIDLDLADVRAVRRIRDDMFERRGELLATARLVGWVSSSDPTLHIEPPSQARWFFGPVGYVLADVRPLATPIPCRGKQGFWIVQPGDEATIIEQERARL